MFLVINTTKNIIYFFYNLQILLNVNNFIWVAEQSAGRQFIFSFVKTKQSLVRQNSKNSMSKVKQLCRLVKS